MGKASVSICNYFIYQPLKDRSRKSILIQGIRVLYSDSFPKYMIRFAMWPVWKSAFSFGIYFSTQASSWFVCSSAEFAHQRCSSTAYTTNYLCVAARFTDEPVTDGQAALRKLLISWVLQAWLPHTLLHSRIVRLFLLLFFTSLSVQMLTINLI